jgi:beta-glucosidase-like glycosyl hydrolase/CubicO group peptidase (beta-lactamase class C family)
MAFENKHLWTTPALVVSLALFSNSCFRPISQAPKPPDKPRAGLPARAGWAEAMLKTLSLEEKVGQMIGVRAFGIYTNPRSPQHKALIEEVEALKIGHITIFESDVYAAPRILNDLQRRARIPLLVGADLERGLAFRVRRGVVPLPYAMAIGATRSEEAAYFTGLVTGREARAIGIHWAFAPVADVNNNPDNPVINIRSYGEDPDLVGKLSSAYVRGARDGAILSTAKHFPGHGDTSADSHLTLPVIASDRERLNRVELAPFQTMFKAGVDAVMVAHIAVPSVDATGDPASLSHAITTGLIRDQMKYEGLIVTDAMEMSGLDVAWSGEASVRAVLAGCDLVLLPKDARIAVREITRAVREGRIKETQIDASVLRLLKTKESLGLDKNRFVDEAEIGKHVGRPEDIAEADRITRESITLVKNEGHVLPLAVEKPLRLLHLVMASDARNDNIAGIPEAEFARRYVQVTNRYVGPDLGPETANDIVAQARSGAFSHVVVSSFVRVTSSKGTADMAGSHANLLTRLSIEGPPLIVLAFGSPYLLRQAPEIPVYLAAYGGVDSAQRAMVAALFGEFEIHGKLPVTLPGLFPFGHGLKIPERIMTLAPASPDTLGFKPGTFDDVDATVARFIESKAFPGAVVAVGRQGGLVHLKAYGRRTYEPDAPAMTTDTLFDLASLTKVIATTTMAMMLVDEGRLDLDRPVRDYFSKFSGGAKDRIRVRDLLTHSSGIDWWAPLYKEARSMPEYLERILPMELKYEPGSKSVYTDLGVMMLGEILERSAGTDLNTFVKRRIFEPLKMRDTGYKPSEAMKARIAPTEVDNDWRKRLIWGEVHDENAFGLGGVAPHAGLFGTAPDLARFATMLLNGGILENRRYIAPATLKRFATRGTVAGSSRALGWDTPSENSSAGHLMSSMAFGHTGFTGTSLWMDPETGVFVILLTNRVHPTRENNQIREARPQIADAVMRGLR